MRYMMLIYSQEDDTAAPEQQSTVLKAHAAFIEETSTRGILRGAEPLKTSSTATMVRVTDGKVLVTDGPYAETREQVAGYYILDCKNLDEAIAWAAKIPTACQGAPGCVEVRPVRELSMPMPMHG